jgi:hypothetical protein
MWPNEMAEPPGQSPLAKIAPGLFPVGSSRLLATLVILLFRKAISLQEGI